jgi:hypothetical protein
MDKIKWDKDEEKVQFVPIFLIGFEEDFSHGVVGVLPAYEKMNEVEPAFALYAIDAAVEMLMQKRDLIEKREVH